jgi:hypothetical protein
MPVFAVEKFHAEYAKEQRSQRLKRKTFGTFIHIIILFQNSG